MRSVFEIVKVTTIEDDSISSVASSSNARVYIGTNNGTLMVYELRHRDGDSKYELIQTVPRFSPSKSSIRRLEAYAMHNLLLSVIDRYVTVHDLVTLKAKTQLPRTKDCEAFIVDSKRACLCAYAKRKLVFYVWNGTDVSSFTEYRRHDMSAAIPPELKDGSTVSLTWADRNVCLGIPDRGYVLVDVETGLVKRKIFDVRFPATTCVCRFAEEDGDLETMNEETDENELLLARENRGYFMDTADVMPSRVLGHCVEWSSPPTQILSVFPYIVSLTNRNQLEIHNAITTKRCQVIKDETVYLSSVSSNNSFVFTTKRAVFACTMVPISKQLSNIASEDYKEALSLCYLRIKNGPQVVDIEIKRKLHDSYARTELKHKKYTSARHHFLVARTKIRDVITLFEKIDFVGNEKALSDLLIPYLVQKRRKIVEDKVLSTTVDTTLFRAYLCVNGASSPVLLAFLRSSNMCDVEECEKALRAYSDTNKRWEALVELYASCNMHRKALNLLSNRLEDEMRDNVVLSDSECRKFVIRMVDYLSSLNDENLVYEFSRPIFNVDCSLALRVFTSTKRTVQLDPRRVLAHLKSCSAGLHEDTLVISYLESMIETNDMSLDVEFHNEIVHQYVDVITEKYDDSSKTEVPIDRETSVKRKSLRTRLMNFLSSENARYDAKQMLEEFPPTRLLEERALLLRRLGLHDRALHIYVHKLKSLKLAVMYCDQVYKVESHSDVYVAFIRTCLRTPPDGSNEESNEKRRVQDAIELMCKYHDRIDPIKVLSLLPITTPVSDLQIYLKLIFSRREHDRRAVPIERELRKLECLRLESEVSKLAQKSVKVTSKDKCSSCGEFLSDTSFSVYLGGNGNVEKIVHSRDECSGVVLNDNDDTTTTSSKISSSNSSSSRN